MGIDYLSKELAESGRVIYHLRYKRSRIICPGVSRTTGCDRVRGYDYITVGIAYILDHSVKGAVTVIFIRITQ